MSGRRYSWDVPKGSHVPPRQADHVKNAIAQAGDGFEEERRELMRRLSAARDGSSPAVQIEVLLLLAQSYERTGAFTDGARAAEDAVMLAGNFGSDADVTESLTALAVLEARNGAIDAALEHQDEARQRSAAAGDRRAAAVALSNLAVMKARQGANDEALDDLDSAFAIARDLDDPWIGGQALHNAATAMAAGQRYDRALPLFQRATLLHQRCGSQVALAKTYNNVGIVHAKLGDLPAAIPPLDMAGAIAADAGDMPSLVATLGNGVVYYEHYYTDYAAHMQREWLEQATGLIKRHLPRRPADAGVLVLSVGGMAAASPPEWQIDASGALLLALDFQLR